MKMKRLFVLWILLVIFNVSGISQDSVILIPPIKEIAFSHCDSNITHISKLFDIVNSYGYPIESIFYKDNVKTIDLNKDGICEYILKYYNGSSFIVNEIYLLKNDELKLIGSFVDGTYSWIESKDAFPQIIVLDIWGQYTNPIWKFSVYRYDGEDYKTFYSPGLSYGQLRDLGLKYYKKENYKLAEIFFKNVLTVSSFIQSKASLFAHDEITDVNNLAISLLKQNKNNEARNLLLDEIKKNRSAESFYNLSLVYRNEGDRKNELKYLIESNEMNQTDFKTKRISELENKNNR
jgi:tetratricopeptide (TPR) repeat protein